MYVRSLHVQHVKLLRDVKVDFVGRDGQPRMWTVFVGENRLCKTTLLQTIAAAALGVDRGTQLVTNVIASWPDLRNPVPLSIEAEFGFSKTPHTDPHPGNRHYPGRRRDVPPILWSKLQLEPKQRVFSGGSGYRGTGADVPDPLAQARATALSYRRRPEPAPGARRMTESAAAAAPAAAPEPEAATEAAARQRQRQRYRQPKR